MPELPEVETTRRGIAPWVEGKTLNAMQVRERRLRWPVPEGLEQRVAGHVVRRVSRRGKYLLLEVADGNLILHLGMSGSLRLVDPAEPPRTHDHVDFILDAGKVLRFHDPRRFGCVLWQPGEVLQHPLLAGLGPEPLGPAFTAAHLYALSRRRKVAVKTFIMDSHVVVGVGNIYANEALFQAGISPRRKASTIGLGRYEKLVAAIRQILARAIDVGGTTLRDFVGGDGKPGYFRQSLNVYGRGGESCRHCRGVLREIRLGQRSTVYCGVCQR